MEVFFINDTCADAVVIFANDFAYLGDGWAQLAPLGDFPGTAMRRLPDGRVETFPSVQRIDRAACDNMVSHFKSAKIANQRYFTGLPIYLGHPDALTAARNTTATEMGIISDLQARSNGLFCKPVFNNSGSNLVETKQVRAFSAHWTADEVGVENINGNPTKVFRPSSIKSAGLTNAPNLPVQMLNERVSIVNAADRGQMVQQLVREEMDRNGNDYNRAYATVQRANPALFAAMIQPRPIAYPLY